MKVGDKDPHSPSVSPATYLSEFCRIARTEWPANRTLTIACHGHSVPAGYFKTPDVRTFESYPHLLHLGLKSHFPLAVINVVVTAIGGEHSQSGAERFERDVLSLRPDVITLDYGLNDRRIGLVASATAWRRMIKSGLEMGIPFILLTPSPDMSAVASDSADPLYQQAEQIRSLAVEYHLALADSLEAFSEALVAGRLLPSLMSQVNHPNHEGHKLIADRLLPWFTHASP